MKRRLEVYGAIVLALVVVWAVLDYFSVEAGDFVWHLRHGFHAEVGGIRVMVPFSYQADSPQGLPELTLIKSGGRISHGGGFISIDFRHPSPQAVEAVEAMLPNKLVTRKRVGDRAVTFAGRSGTCVEYIPQISDSRINEIIQATDPRDIDCWFGDLGVELLGSSNLKEDFYNIIRAAEPVQRKN